MSPLPLLFLVAWSSAPWLWVVAQTAGVEPNLARSEILLRPGEVYANFDSIEGTSGGGVNTKELFFSRIDGDMQSTATTVHVEMLLVKVGPDCLDYTQDYVSSCWWASSGVGAWTDPDGPYSFCCTQELLDSGKCVSLGRAIVGTYYADWYETNFDLFDLHFRLPTFHRLVPLPPPQDDGDSAPPKIYCPSLKLAEAGRYALLLLNCNNANVSVQVSGHILWEWPDEPENDTPPPSASGTTASPSTILNKEEKKDEEDIDGPPQEPGLIVSFGMVVLYLGVVLVLVLIARKHPRQIAALPEVELMTASK